MKSRWLSTIAGLVALSAALAISGVNLASDNPPAPRLPAAPGVFAPAYLEPVDGETLDADQLVEPESCSGCHSNVVVQWRSSAHALASFNNPFYRASINRYRDAVGFEMSRFCAACHDLPLLMNGGIDEEVRPDDRLAHAGIGCGICHGAVSVAPDGNGSFALTTRPIPVPTDGDPESLEQHRERVASPTLHSPDLCVSCHRGFLGPETGNAHYLIGMDDATDWQRSPYAGTGVELIDDPLPELTCGDCHMPAEDGVRSHRFAGSHTALAAALSDERQLNIVSDFMKLAITVDIPALRSNDGTWWLPPDGVPIEPGDSVTFDVVLRNVGAGHRFPGGTLDLQDTWVQVEVRTADDRLIASAGAQHEETGEDETAHRLTTFPVDADAGPEPFHVVSNFRAIAWDTTILPRDAAVVRYQFELPDDLAVESFPIEVTARLRHRRHHLPFQAVACEASRSVEGQAYADASRAAGHIVVDACQGQPVVDLAAAEVWIGPGAPAGDETRPIWRRLYDHALGLSHNVQERLDEARPSLERALDEVAVIGTDREHAMVLVLLASIEGRQGRTEVSLGRLAEAEALLPEHPAIDFQRGEALSLVWRWPEAADAYASVAARVPHSDVAWQRLARALISAGRSAEAFDAAEEGLRLQPRDPSLLLSQMLALDALGADDAAVEAAREAYLRYRPYDEAPQIRLRCFQEVEECARERLPVHVHEMRSP